MSASFENLFDKASQTIGYWKELAEARAEDLEILRARVAELEATQATDPNTITVTLRWEGPDLYIGKILVAYWGKFTEASSSGDWYEAWLCDQNSLDDNLGEFTDESLAKSACEKAVREALEGTP